MKRQAEKIVIMANQSQSHTEQTEPLIKQPRGSGSYRDDHSYGRKKSRIRFTLLTAFLFFVFIFLVAAIIVITIIVIEKDKNKDQFPSSNSILGVYKHAAVASDVGICSEIGRKILEQHNGSAVDSAIATLLCMGLADAQSMGIGGGFFMVIYNRKNKETTVIDARECAPLNATKDMFEKDPEKSTTGGLSIAVPGEIKGYWEAHKRFGKLKWSDLFEPAITMATDGFPVPSSLAKVMVKEKHYIFKDPALKEIFVNPETGELFKTGELMKRPLLAKTMRKIADNGGDEFYKGSLSKDLAADIQERDGIVTEEDLKQYEVKIRQPLKITLQNGLTVHGLPPPSSGAVAMFVFNILDGYNFTPKSISSVSESVLTYHRIVEAFKFAYARRSALGDEDFWDVKELIRNLTSRDYADFTRSRITDNETHDVHYYHPAFENQLKTGTSHLSVVGPDGDAVSVTTTINLHFGSKVRGNRTGIIFNDEMDDFSSPNKTNFFGIPPSPSNFIAPMKRPMSSMTPLVITDEEGNVTMVIGAAGGSRIISSTCYSALRTLWLDENIKQAIDARRLHDQLVPTEVFHEPLFPQDFLDGLLKKGHNLTEQDLSKSIVQGIHCKENLKYANCDFRKGGYPDGY